ncbi:MAG: VCBS repeat-containing protein [Cytophagales bacterium]|nr:VCBS repeat-containing protein [Cytophagales bacterium]
MAHLLQRTLLVFSLLLVLACQSKPNYLFTQLHPVDFENTLIETAAVNILNYEYAYNGGGVAAADFNNDGWCDLYFTGNMVSNRLFLNKRDFTFEDITAKAGVEGRELWKTGVTTVDINADGWMDIYVCYSGPELGQSFSNQLFINNGAGPDGIPTFTDQAPAYGLDAPGTFSTQALFFDYDRDGDLDMILINHANHFFSPFVNTASLRSTRHPQFGNRLYRNDSPEGKILFTDVSEEAGIHGGGINFGLGVSVSDINNDGWPDLYISNDYEEQDFLYLNNRNGTFSNVTKTALGHFSRNGMGTDIADYNNDGLPDLVEVDMWPEDNFRQKLLKGPDDYNRYQLMLDSGFLHQQMRNTLQVNTGITENGVPVFSEIGQLAGIAATDWSWAPLFADLDNDGLKDLFISNGYLRDFTSMDFLKFTVEEARAKAVQRGEQLNVVELVSKMASTKTTDYAFRNAGDLTFENVTHSWGLSTSNLSFGATYADLDNDGDLELITNNTNEPATIWKSNSERINNRNYLAIELEGPINNPVGIGSKVYVQTPAHTQLIEQYLTRGFQSAVDPVLHVGLGNNTTATIRIVWPDGLISEVNQVTANQKIKLKYDHAVQPVSAVQDFDKLFTEITSATDVQFVHTENKFVDFDREPLLPVQPSRRGPALATADVNGDGIDDFYLGGAIGQSGMLYLSKLSGKFGLAPAQPWSEDKNQEDVSAVFFDADGDGDLDLFVVSGGNEYANGSAMQDDRLYLNDGRGTFKKTPPGSIVADHASGSCVAVADYDQDGDLDLFVGGASVPGNFPFASPGAILRNDTDRKTGTIKFTVATHDVNPELRAPGIVTDAVWTDFNKDGWPDLIVVGEWMPVRFFENNKGKLVELILPQQDQLHGLWCRVVAADLDNDGDEDIIVGNAGANLPWKVSPAAPLKLLYGDFDADGKTDPLMAFTVAGNLYPVPSRDELLRQLPFLKKKFISYDSYARATMSEILDATQLAQNFQLQVTTLQSVILENVGSGFNRVDLPNEAQFSSLSGISIFDFDGDGKLDILTAGNYYPYSTQWGPADASKGLLLKATTGVKFTPVPWSLTGFYAPGDVRNMKLLSGKQNDKFIILARNNDSISMFKVATR